MRVGLDFDNTVVSYDALFHKVAREGDLIPKDTPVSKVSVRDHLRKAGKEELWTEMQGTVYGGRMAEAAPFPGVIAFLSWARAVGMAVSIVSHKTRYPFLGTQYDLHTAARDWIAQNLSDASGPLVFPEHVHFELTKEGKLARIGAIACSAYMDDLPEILLAPAFPAGTERLLFDPDGHHREVGLRRLPDWAAARAVVEDLWRRTR
jgi:hypothetical protein